MGQDKFLLISHEKDQVKDKKSSRAEKKILQIRRISGRFIKCFYKRVDKTKADKVAWLLVLVMSEMASSARPDNEGKGEPFI